MKRIRLNVVASRAPAAGRRRAEPVTCGLPFPRGFLASVDGLTLTNVAGQPQPIQTRVLDHWSDGSVRWALIDSQVDWSGAASHYWLATSVEPTSEPEALQHRLSIVEQADTIVIDTGVARFTCRERAPFPFASVTDAQGADVISVSQSGLRVRAADGAIGSPVIERVELDERGPWRSSIRLRGRIARGSVRRWLEFDVRAEFFAGLSTVRFGLTIRNPRAALHPGNFWELGDAGSILLREAALTFVPTGDGAVWVECSIADGMPLRPFDQPFDLYQESSGGQGWQSRVHVNRDGRVPMQTQGYRLQAGPSSEAGLRASPIVKLTRDATVVTAGVPQFWQNFPRAIEVRDNSLVLGLWPSQFPDVHELQGGEQKTHEFVVAFGPDSVSDIPLDWCRSPALMRADPSWYCLSGAVPHLVADEADSSAGYLALVRAAIEGDDTFAAKRERIDEYGWRNFGDLYADHEAALQPCDPPLVSHYNNQYDAIAGFALQFFRSGDAAWWMQMVDGAAHLIDIDLYHATDGKPAYSGGPFWHTAHYVDAGRSTHRSYPRAPGVGGGGPGCEHNYTAGLLLHHFLTGNNRSRDAAIQLADWVIQIDDGSRTPFRWLCRGDTGLASATREGTYHGPGRGAAHSIAALLDGHRLTRQAAYLDKAEQLIRRSIHPDDDVDARGLLDAERRWSYTVFLQVLGRYLDESAEGGRRGQMYAWARESLLRYARWMVAHERPYLETPGQLEYPTETWAAQDVRKCDVLLLASMHARDDGERKRLRTRAAYFFQSSVDTLTAMTTRTLTRPVVILLTNGFSRAWFDSHPDASLPGPDCGPCEFGSPRAFVPQRARAITRAAWILGSTAAACAAMLVGRLLW